MSPFSKENLPFFLRKLHSLTGTLPLGLFVLLHLRSNSEALRGQRAFEEGAFRSGPSAFFVLLEIVCVYLPLAFHAAYGLSLVVRERAELLRRAPPRGAAWALDRASSVVVFAFVTYHLAELRLPVALGRMRPADLFPTLCDTLSATTSIGVPVAATVYLVGLAALSYHLARGLLGFCATFRVPLAPRGRRWVLAAAIVVGVGTFALGAVTVLYFATGSGIPGMSSNDSRPQSRTL